MLCSLRSQYNMPFYDHCASINQLLLGDMAVYYKDLHFKHLTLGNIKLANVFAPAT